MIIRLDDYGSCLIRHLWVYSYKRKENHYKCELPIVNCVRPLLELGYYQLFTHEYK